MLLNLIVAAIVLLTAYMWTAQGFFSALIHLVCTLVAGAVAFALWEPLTYGLLLGAVPTIAWSVGLVLPYLITLLICRLISDRIITSDPKLPGTLDFVGGGVCGAGAGVLSAGILVIGVGFMPVGSAFLGHRLMDYDTSGNLIKTTSLWIPADELTARFYETASRGAFSPGATALASRMPRVEQQASLLRATYDDRGRTTLRPSDFKVIATYTVQAPSLAELTSDSFNALDDGSTRAQDVKRTNGEEYPAASMIHGYTIEFASSAVEKSGQVLVGPGQVRLICRLADGTSEGFQPAAVVAQSSGRELSASRYRFDTKDVYIGSAGRAKNPTLSFEFVTPADATPVDLLVKQVRVNVAGLPAPREMSVQQRDDAVYALELVGLGEEGPSGPRPDPVTPTSSAGGAGQDLIRGDDRNDLSSAGVNATRAIAGLTISRQDRGGLRVNDDNEITGGEHTFATEDITGKRVPQDLKIDSFAAPAETAVVQINVSLSKRASLLGRAVDAAEMLLPPILTDSLGQQYEAVGYIFQAGDRTVIRYEASNPVRAMSELPSLSRSRPGDELILLFQVNDGVELTTFSLGSRVEVLRFEPALVVRAR